MSHFTRVQTQLRDIDTVHRALIELGYSVVEGKVRGYGNQQAQADIVVKLEGGYDIGFRKAGGVITLVADMWGLKVERDQFLAQVSQKYAYFTILDQATQQGWQIAGEEVQTDGSVKLIMQRWS